MITSTWVDAKKYGLSLSTEVQIENQISNRASQKKKELSVRVSLPIHSLPSHCCCAAATSSSCGLSVPSAGGVCLVGRRRASIQFVVGSSLPCSCAQSQQICTYWLPPTPCSRLEFPTNISSSRGKATPRFTRCRQLFVVSFLPIV
ncbi:hypothetical protein BS78_05G254800 [Paspalum vaginatum]|nr:hypothetical protein BS78_05G254800 [Paspalum vaginatum]